MNRGDEVIRFTDEQFELLKAGQTTPEQAAVDTMAAFDTAPEYAMRALLMAMLRKNLRLAGFAYFGAAKALEEGQA